MTLKKQAAAAAAAAAEHLAQIEEAHAMELGKIKSDATNALTTLMQVGNKQVCLLTNGL